VAAVGKNYNSIKISPSPVIADIRTDLRMRADQRNSYGIFALLLWLAATDAIAEDNWILITSSDIKTYKAWVHSSGLYIQSQVSLQLKAMERR